MKNLKILITLIAISIVITSCNNSNAASKVNKENLNNAKARDLEIKRGAASISFDKTEYDYGTVNEGDIVETSFKVINSGKSDLVIINAQPSCGCTVPTWPKEPIKPGESAAIEVKFDTSGKQNQPTKTITLNTNTETGRQILTLKGSIIPKKL